MKPRSLRWNPMQKIALAAFIFWSLAGLIFTCGHISPATVVQWPIHGWLVQFVDFCLRTGDPILIILAFINSHLHAVRQWSEGIARRWGATILVGAFAIESLGATTGFPFGQYHYTDRFGPVLGVVPLTIPLAWHIVVTNALFLVRTVAPHASRTGEAIMVGVISTLYDFILEPFATSSKHYWIWTEGTVPPLNYVAWFVLSALFARLFAPTLSNHVRFDPRPAFILGLTVLIFLAGEYYP